MNDDDDDDDDFVIVDFAITRMQSVGHPGRRQNKEERHVLSGDCFVAVPTQCLNAPFNDVTTDTNNNESGQLLVGCTFTASLASLVATAAAAFVATLVASTTSHGISDCTSRTAREGRSGHVKSACNGIGRSAGQIDTLLFC